jgi:uncharacterized protein (TIRG00374 family)
MLSTIQRLIRARIHLARHVVWPGLLALGILAALTWMAGWKPVWAALRQTSAPILALSLAVYAATWVFRTLRLHSLTDRAGLPTGRLVLFRLSIAAQALNSVLPARIGDVANVLYLHWQGLAFGRAAAIVVQSRVLDAVALVLVSAPALLVLAGAGQPPGWVMGGLLLCALFAALPSILVGLDKQTKLFARLENLFVRRGAGVFKLTVQASHDFLGEYREIIRDRRLWIRTLAQSFVVAFGEGLTAWVIAKAVGAEVSMLMALFAVSLATIGKSATVTPGGLGIYEAVFVAVLRLFGVGFDLALLVAILDHGLKKGFNLLIGLPALTGSGLRGSSTKEKAPTPHDCTSQREEALITGECGGQGAEGGARNAEPPEKRWTLTAYGLVLLACLAVVSALHWSWYPIQSDPWYHTAVIQGMHQAGGLPVWDFWEMAPAGRPHIYPPSFHVVGYLVSLAGVSPPAFSTFMSWGLWWGSMFTMWLWMHKVFGPRPALAAVILLSGPTAYFAHQTTFPGIAFGMALAPLALLALESERFLACAVLNLLASTAHPMALFLPPALVINTLLRRKKLLAGLLAACLPMLLYGPWLAHGWANRAFLPEQRSGADVSLMGIGIANGVNLGVALAVAACLGIIWAVVRRREALGLLGPLLGSAVVFPMGFGGRLLQFNIHWPLACLGGYGSAMLLEWLERRFPRRLATVRVISVSLAFVALATWAAVEIPLPKKTRTGAVVPVPKDPNRPSRPGVTNTSPPVFVALNTSMFLRLLDPEMNPPGWRFERAGVRINRGVRPPNRAKPNLYHQEGAQEFLNAVTRLVAIGEVIYTGDGGGSSFLTGCTGRWATGGMLHEEKWNPIKAEYCQFLATMSGKPGRGAKLPPDCFTNIFENSFGALYKNNVSLPKRTPVKAVVSTLDLVVLAGLGICLVLFDLWLPRGRVRARLLLGGGAFVVALSCVATLAWTAAGELLSPPKVTAGKADTPISGPPMVPGKAMRDQQKPQP